MVRMTIPIGRAARLPDGLPVSYPAAAAPSGPAVTYQGWGDGALGGLYPPGNGPPPDAGLDGGATAGLCGGAN